MAKSKEKESKDSTKAHVIDSKGRVARTYSREIHGDSFVELATEFAQTHKHPSVVEE